MKKSSVASARSSSTPIKEKSSKAGKSSGGKSSSVVTKATLPKTQKAVPKASTTTKLAKSKNLSSPKKTVRAKSATEKIAVKQTTSKKNNTQKYDTKKTITKVTETKINPETSSKVEKVAKSEKQDKIDKSSKAAKVEKNEEPETKPTAKASNKGAEPAEKMNQIDLDYFHVLLNEKKDTLLQELGYLEDNSLHVNAKEGSGDNSSVAYHLADHATETQDKEQAFLLASREGKYLNHIEDALDRIRNGVYGSCSRCKKLIPKARLEAVPTAKMCVKCKEAMEKDRSSMMTTVAEAPSIYGDDR